MFRLRVCARVRIYIFRLDIAFKTWQHYRSFSFYRNLFIYLIFIFVFTINLPISSKCHVEQLSSLRIIDISLKKKRKKREKKEKSFETRFKISQRIIEENYSSSHPSIIIYIKQLLGRWNMVVKKEEKKKRTKSAITERNHEYKIYIRISVFPYIYMYIYIHSRKEDIANKARVEK